MHFARLIVLTAALAGAAVSAGAQVAAVPPPAAPAPVILVVDRALDGRGSELRNSRIAIENGKIASVNGAMSGTAVTLDLRGYTVLPGWIDTHVHLDSHFDRSGRIATDKEPPLEQALGIAQAAWETLMGGFTTVQSVGDLAERPQIGRAHV